MKKFTVCLLIGAMAASMLTGCGSNGGSSDSSDSKADSSSETMTIMMNGSDSDAFMEGYRNIEEMQLSFLHVFPYSKRDFTDAAKMPGHLDRKTKKARGAKLAQLSKELYTSYKQRFIGQKISVLFEKEVEGMLFGHSSEYLEVYAKKEAGALHTLCDVLISELKDDVLYGVCVKEETL